MQTTLNILAAADDSAVKLIFGVIVAIIWGIGALVNVAKKKQKDSEGSQQHQESWARIEQEMRERAVRAQSALGGQPGVPPGARPAPPPLPAGYRPPPPPPEFAPTRSIEGPYVPPRPVAQRAVAQRPAPAPRRVVARPVSQPAQPKPKKQKPKAPAAGRQAPLSVPVSPIPVAPNLPQAGAPRAANGADSVALSRWLTPKTLRAQFMLTEILQPPLALREEREYP